MDEWICDRVGILIVLVLAASVATSVIWDIDYKRQVSERDSFASWRMENAYRNLRERQPEDPEIIYLGSKIKPDLELRQK